MLTQCKMVCRATGGELVAAHVPTLRLTCIAADACWQLTTGKHSFFAGVYNLITCILGSGIIAMPYALESAGLGPSIYGACCPLALSRPRLQKGVGDQGQLWMLGRESVSSSWSLWGY